jgi:protein pelota
MKVIFKDFSKGELKVQVQNMEDLWYLSHIVDENDVVSGKTFRKIKIGQEPNVKIIRKPVFLKIEVEKVEFHKFSNSLRVSGKVVEGTEEVGKGSYHTFDLDEGTIISINKIKWYKYQIDKVEEALKEKNVKVLICVLDRESVGFALLKNYGYDYLSDIESDMRKKGDEGKEKESNFYSELSKQMKQYVDRYNIQNIVIGSPAFWKDDLMKVVKKKNPELVKIITLATCNNTGRNGVNEVLKRDEVKTVLSQDRATKEMNLVEELLGEIAKDGKAAYGFKEVKAAAEAGAVKKLLVVDDMISDYRNDGNYAELDAIMKSVDNAQGEIIIISSEHDGGKKLKGLGNIGGLLRYKS